MGRIIAIVWITALGYFLNLSVFSSNYDEENHEFHLKYKDCKLLEVDHYNGFFKGSTNKLDCNGVIYNVSTDDYDRTMINN